MATNNVLTKVFQGTGVEIIIENGEPLFEIYTTGMALGYVKKNSIGKIYPQKDRIDNTVKNAGISMCVHGVHSYLDEDMLYDFMFEAKTDKCKEFRSWVKMVLKEIRQNGGYIADNATPEQVIKIVEAYSFQNITKQIKECDILKLKEVVTNILDINSKAGKKQRDEYHKKMDEKEYKQHLREHIRKAVLEREYPKDYRSAVETAIRLEILEELDRDLLTTERKSYSQKLGYAKRTYSKDILNMGLNAVELVNALSKQVI